MRNRIPAAIAAGGILLAALASGLTATGPASAHTPDLSCTGSVVHVDLRNYPAQSTVSGSIDGVDLGSTQFGPGPFTFDQPIDTTIEHTYDITVTGSDGQGNKHWTGKTSELCGVPITPPTTPPTEPPVVLAPLVQDYITCEGGAFVLDNTGSTEAVVYTVNGVDFTVPAGQAVHTDADGTLLQPTADLGGYLVTAGEQSWTFPAAGDCGTTTPTTPIPVEGTPVVTITPDTCESTPKVVTWDIPDGLSIGGVTGSGSAVDVEAAILNAATSGTMHPRSWVLPITVAEGFSYDGPLTITLTQERDEASCTPPTGEPTTPAPSDGPTTAPTGSPSPTAGTTPPASSPSAPSGQPTAGGSSPHSTTPASTASAAPVAADTSHDGTAGELAYTGSNVLPIGIGVTVGLLALGGIVFLLRRAARSHAISTSDDR